MELTEVDKLIDEVHGTLTEAEQKIRKYQAISIEAKKVLKAMEDARVLLGGEKRSNGRNTKKFPVTSHILNALGNEQTWGIDGLINYLKGNGWNPKQDMSGQRNQVRTVMERLVKDGQVVSQGKDLWTFYPFTPPESAEGDFALAQ